MVSDDPCTLISSPEMFWMMRGSHWACQGRPFASSLYWRKSKLRTARWLRECWDRWGRCPGCLALACSISSSDGNALKHVSILTQKLSRQLDPACMGKHCVPASVVQVASWVQMPLFPWWFCQCFEVNCRRATSTLANRSASSNELHLGTQISRSKNGFWNTCSNTSRNTSYSKLDCKGPIYQIWYELQLQICSQWVNTPEGLNYGSCPFSHVIAFGKSGHIRLIHVAVPSPFFLPSLNMSDIFWCLLASCLGPNLLQQSSGRMRLIEAWILGQLYNDQDVVRHLGINEILRPYWTRQHQDIRIFAMDKKTCLLHFHVLSRQVPVTSSWQ